MRAVDFASAPRARGTITIRPDNEGFLLGTAPAIDRRVVLTQCRITAEKRLAAAIGPLLDALASHLVEAGQQTKERDEREQCHGAAHRLAQEHARYFEAFRREFTARFDGCAHALLTGGPGADELDREALAMLKTNILENEVAVIKLSVHFKTRAAAELDELSRRLCTLLRRHALEDAHNPVGPLTIAHAVHSGFAALRVASRAARVIRPKVEEALIAPVQELYRTLNSLLGALNIVPASPPRTAPPEPDPLEVSAPMAVPSAPAPEVPAPACEVAAARAVAAALSGRTLPPAIEDFLKRDWRDLLARVHMRQGGESRPWLDAVATMAELVRTLQPNAADRTQSVGNLPALAARLNAAMDAMALDPARRKRVVDALRSQRPDLPPRASANSAAS